MEKNTKYKKWLIACLLVFLGSLLFFAYKLREVPPGLTVDEAAFGYNGALLSKTGRDQNGKVLPFFVLSIEGADWRQPVTQYATAIFFKLFGPSLFTLRFVSVLVGGISVILIMLLVKKLWGGSSAFLAAVIFVTTPIFFMQTHMALDNIMPVPFILGWLISLYLSKKTGKRKYLILAGICLGTAFYSYKAMRLIVPVLGILSLIYLSKNSFYFLLGTFPFVAIIPYLRFAYPGALVGGFRPHDLKWDEFFYPYLSSFDPSFLFIKGDDTVYHSTGMHGMFLLATLPLFLIGCYEIIQKKDKFLLLILTSFFLSPIGFGLVNSVHRASRLLAIVPFYTIIAALGFYSLQKRKTLQVVFGVLLILNFFSFVKYYFSDYPKFVKSDFSQTKEENYIIFSKIARERELLPVIDRDLYKADGEVSHFYEAAYFDKKLIQVGPEDKLQDNYLLMTYRENLAGVQLIQLLPNYRLYAK